MVPLWCHYGALWKLVDARDFEHWIQTNAVVDFLLVSEESKIIAAWSIEQIILTEEYFWAFIGNWADQSETRFNYGTYSIVPLMNYFVIFPIYSKT